MISGRGSVLSLFWYVPCSHVNSFGGVSLEESRYISLEESKFYFVLYCVEMPTPLEELKFYVYPIPNEDLSHSFVENHMHS